MNDKEVWHVMPVNDLREHDDSKNCWCNPLYDQEDNIYIHNSMDNREKYESGEIKQH